MDISIGLLNNLYNYFSDKLDLKIIQISGDNQQELFIEKDSLLIKFCYENTYKFFNVINKDSGYSLKLNNKMPMTFISDYKGSDTELGEYLYNYICKKSLEISHKIKLKKIQKKIQLLKDNEKDIIDNWIDTNKNLLNNFSIEKTNLDSSYYIYCYSFTHKDNGLYISLSKGYNGMKDFYSSLEELYVSKCKRKRYEITDINDLIKKIDESVKIIDLIPTESNYFKFNSYGVK